MKLNAVSSATAKLSTEYRAKADDCRRQSERSIRMADKARWLIIAEEWLTLAQQIDKKNDRSATR
jgi:hypothetical protein